MALGDEICRNMMDKTLNNIDCSSVNRKLLEKNEIHLYKDRSQVFNETHYINETAILRDGENKTIHFDVTKLEVDVCNAETQSQILRNQVFTIYSYIDAFASILVILFAGGWSDRNRKRKPCMLLPMFGDLSSSISKMILLNLSQIVNSFFFVFSVQLIAVSFFDYFSIEFTMLLSLASSSVTGGSGLLVMAVMSYLAETTPPEDHMLRLNLFIQVNTILPIILFPSAGPMFKLLGYFSEYSLQLSTEIMFN